MTELDRSTRAAALHEPHARRRGQSVVELDAVAQRGERTRRGNTFDFGEIRLHHTVARVGEELRELAVVGEHEEPGGVVVETSHREHTGVGRHEIEHGGAALRIAGRRDHTDRLVQQVVDEVVVDDDGHAVELDALVLRVGAAAEPRDFAVDGDAPRADELLTRAPRAEARRAPAASATVPVRTSGHVTQCGSIRGRGRHSKVRRPSGRRADGARARALRRSTRRG